jgi:hypothetical protein
MRGGAAARASKVFSPADIRPPNSQLDVIRAACDGSLDLDADTAIVRPAGQTFSASASRYRARVAAT